MTRKESHKKWKLGLIVIVECKSIAWTSREKIQEGQVIADNGHKGNKGIL